MILKLILLYRSRCLLSFKGSKAFKGPLRASASENQARTKKTLALADSAWCETLSSPALSWLAKPQAEERRDWEADSASKPAPTASDSHSWASEPKNLETPLF